MRDNKYKIYINNPHSLPEMVKIFEKKLSAFQDRGSVLCRHMSSGVRPVQKLQVGTSLDISVKKNYKYLPGLARI